MKTLLLITTFAASLATAAALHAQDASFVTPRVRAHNGNAPARLSPRTDGVIPRAVRSGQPWQMLNPAAPAEFGRGQDTVRREGTDPDQRAQGLKLFVVEF